ncbi:hypothetical protein ABZZ20_33260 [Streptomyces sp. NPDC006430]|uniref:hypothetical protein n=1 Tax=Streptomyces sp. NPDC006430 TaxID=3154299 RepID=UPI0033B9F31E
MTAFDEVYQLPDPRGYFTLLSEYRTPHHAQVPFRRIIEARRAQLSGPAEPFTVLDLCSSYGINAALINHDLTLDELNEHYTSAEAAKLSTDELIEWDRYFYAARRRPDAVRFLGLDKSAPALSYARAVGLLDECFPENLEAAEPSAGLLRAARTIQLITLTGGASFLTPRTFHSLLGTAPAQVWVAAFVLRTVSYQDIEACLESYGLTTERAEATHPQRPFTDLAEQRYAIRAVTALGEDPSGKEADGYFHARLHLSRPVGEKGVGLEEFVSV